MNKQHLGIIGLGVMGHNLALNAASKGFSVAGYDQHMEKVREFTATDAGDVLLLNSLDRFIESLETPRRIWMMVPAGAVDTVLRELMPLLGPEDIVIDGGNSHFRDTERRAKDIEAAGQRFFGMGVSAGAEGALHGPSLMPGGHEPSYRRLEPLLTRMAAQASDGPCCTYLGPGGEGHYVKMVHNGIEYGLMHLIAEGYDLLRTMLGFEVEETRAIFAKWNSAELSSFLLEITVTALGKIDPETRRPLVESVLDEAEQKGTGKWTAQDAFDLSVAVPTFTSAVEARILSGLKDERVRAAAILRGPGKKFSGRKEPLLTSLRQALHVSVTTCYAQGFAQMKAASAEYGYNLKLAEIARIWKGGCIIRARLLDPIQAAFRARSDLENLMLDPFFSRVVNEGCEPLRELVGTAVGNGLPCPAFGSSLAYMDTYRRARLPANLVQAQRDYFGGHTYRRLDKEGVFHTDWDK